MGRDIRPNEPETADVAEGMSGKSVAAYLAAHPEFLTEHPELLARLAPRPAVRPDGVIDLQSFMVERLRAELDRLKQQQRGLISATRANQNSQNRVHNAILFLLDAENFEQLIQAITTDLAVILDLDVACLLVESNGEEVPHVPVSGVRVVGEGAIEHWLDGRDIVLDGDITGAEAVFGSGAGLVRSQALIRLNISRETPPAMLALGSREPDMFQAGMRTELMGFLAKVLERCIRSWLDLPS